MSTLSSLEIKVTLSAAQAEALMRQLRSTSDESMRGVSDSVGKTKRSFTELNQMLELGKKALSAFTAVVRGAGGLIEAAQKQEIAETKLANAMRNVEGASRDAAKQLMNQASALQELTGIGDETIISAQAMLGTFQLNGKEIETLTPRILDMAASMQQATGQTQDLQQLSIAMGKALTGGSGALTRYGVALTESQRAAYDAAEGMEKVNMLAEILDANFKGAAESLGNTSAGAWQKLSATMGDVKENLGFVLINILKPLMPTIKTIAERIKELTDRSKLDQWAGKLGTAVGKIADGLMPVMDALAPALEVVMDIINELLPPLAELVAVLMEALSPVLEMIGDLLRDLSPVIGSVIRVVAALVVALSPLIKVFGELTMDIVKPLMPLLQLIADLLVSLVPIIELLVPVIAALVGTGVQLIQMVVTPLVDSIKYIIENATAAVNAIASIFGGDDENKKQSGGGGSKPKTAPPQGDAPPVPGIVPPAGGRQNTGGGGDPEAAKKAWIERNELIGKMRDLELDREGILKRNLELEVLITGELRERTTIPPPPAHTSESELEREEELLANSYLRIEQLRADNTRGEIARIDALHRYEIDALQYSLDLQQITYEEFTEQKLAIDRKYEEQKANVQRSNAQQLAGDLAAFSEEAFGSAKAFSYAQAVMNVEEGATKALAQGGIWGAALMAAVLLKGYASIRKIMDAKPVRREAGGLVRGGRQLVEINEAGEEYVVNARATRRNLPLLEALNAGMSIADATGMQPAAPDLSRMTRTQRVQFAGDFRFEDGALRAAIEQEVELEEQGTL